MRTFLVDGFRSQGLRDRMGSRLKLRCSRFATRQWGQQHPTSADRDPHICYMYLSKLLHVFVKVSEYQQYQEATIDDEDFEGEDEEGEME